MAAVLAAIAMIWPDIFASYEPSRTSGIETPSRSVRLELSFDGEASVVIDGEVRGLHKDGAIMQVRPGRHKIELRRDGKVIAQRTMLLSSAGTSTIRFE